MQFKDNIVSLQIKNLVYVCEDEPKENLIIVYEDEDRSDCIKIHSISILLDAIENWWEE